MMMTMTLMMMTKIMWIMAVSESDDDVDDADRMTDWPFSWAWW
jgi:hypothetical protein